MWLLVYTDRLVVGRVPDGATTIDGRAPETHPMKAVHLFRDRRPVADALVVRCGDHRLTVAGSMTRSFEARFGAVFQLLGRHADDGERVF